MKKTSYNIHWKEKNIILYHKLISLMNLKLHQVCRYSFNEKDRELNIKRVCIILLPIFLIIALVTTEILLKVVLNTIKPTNQIKRACIHQLKKIARALMNLH
jgi:hypothetical protein